MYLYFHKPFSKTFYKLVTKHVQTFLIFFINKNFQGTKQEDIFIRALSYNNVIDFFFYQINACFKK